MADYSHLQGCWKQRDHWFALRILERLASHPFSYFCGWFLDHLYLIFNEGVTSVSRRMNFIQSHSNNTSSGNYNSVDREKASEATEAQSIFKILSGHIWTLNVKCLNMTHR